MKKKEAAAALAILSAVSALCLKGMRAVGDRILRKEKEKEELFKTDEEQASP